MASAEVETLVAEPEFKALINGYRALHAMPDDEQRRILTQLARHLLMEATALGDVRVAMFILLQERMGKDPARTLADGVIAANRRAAAPQGKRMNACSCALADEALEVDRVPPRALPAVLERGCGLGLVQQVQGHVPDHGHVLRRMAGAQA